MDNYQWANGPMGQWVGTANKAAILGSLSCLQPSPSVPKARLAPQTMLVVGI